MNNPEDDVAQNTSNQRLAAEVLELGESLFEMALGVTSHQPTENEKAGAYPVEEMRAAADEFFTALRLLLEIAE